MQQRTVETLIEVGQYKRGSSPAESSFSPLRHFQVGGCLAPTGMLTCSFTAGCFGLS